MSVIQSGNVAHDNAVRAAEGVRQASVAAASTQAAVKAAEITFYRAVQASCRANNNSAGLEAADVALQALQGTST
jgi:hypothetical protein